MPSSIVSVQDGPRLTVAMLMKSATVIPKRVLSMLDQEFLVDAVLRKGNDTPSGVVNYFESTPLFSNEDPQVLDEFGTIPTTNGSLGNPRVVRSVRRALGLRVSKTMQDRNNLDAINVQIVQIRNTMVRAWEDAFFSALIANANVQTVATANPWGADGSHIRADINGARYLIKNAASDSAGKQKLGYQADTLIISTETEFDLLNSSEVATPFSGNIADENLQYTGKLPQKFLTLDVLVSWRLTTYAPDSAIVLQRNVIGGISDERSLQATPMYGEGNGPNGGPNEAWRTDITRASAIFIDQPKCAVIITGVTGDTDVTFDGVTLGDSETFPVSGGAVA